MAGFAYSLDDSSGESLGDGLDFGASSLTGDTALDDGFDDTDIGSSLDLAGAGVGSGVTDSPSLDDQFNLSGVSDAIPSETLDSGSDDTNGSGSAADVHIASSSAAAASSTSSVFSGIAKFGSSIGQLLAGHGATGTVVAGAPANANPNRSIVSGLTAGNTLFIVGVVIVVAGVIAFSSGGSN